MTKLLKNFALTLLCIVCLIPYLLVLTGNATITRIGGNSTMGVVVGPIFGLDDVLDGGISVDSGVSTQKDWSASTGVVRSTPYANGALKKFSSLYVVNDKFSKSYKADRKYASFVKYFKIVRTDGRPIYDDDGILDVRWWQNGEFTPSDEIVDYAANLYVSTQMLDYDYRGFLGTVLYSKFESGEFLITFSREQDPEDVFSSALHDKNPNNYGAGAYKNNGLNPGFEYYKIADMHTTNSPYVFVELNARGYWENCFWGGCYDYIDIRDCLSGFMPRANRDWSNELTTKNNVGIGTYKERTAYYSPKAFTVIARNLNNLIKINEVEVTPQYGTSVVPYKDGHHIEITDEGVTRVQIEEGAEGRYTSYYCFVDTTLPDVSYTFHNSNATEKRKVGNITTNNSGAKSQTIYEGIFKDQVQINFDYDENVESPEIATCTFNGETFEITSGTWFNEEGDYTITITDKAGNATISQFTIDKSKPSYNLERLQNDTSYKITKWYLTTIPSGYNGYGSYSFKEEGDAFSFACEMENQNKVTGHYLNNIEDFIDTHLVATGNTVQVGPYWYYKSRENPELYVYYFDENSLNEVIAFYAQDFVSDEQTYRLNSSIYPNNYGNHIDESVYDNIIVKNGIEAYIVNNFTFRYVDDIEASQIFYDYAEDDKENWIEFQFNKSFASQVNAHGLYKIKEVDFVGNETTYYVFFDKEAPLLDIKVKVYGNDKSLTQTISVNDIPKNGELVLYYEDFEILEIIEDDKWYVLEVRCPDGTTKRYTYLDDLPDFSELGSGEFNITIGDRLNNQFKFKLFLLGEAPKANFEIINANSQLEISITTGEEYNTLTDLKIYRNGILLNSEYGYDEYPNDDSNSLIFVDKDTLKYIFNKGGIYVVEISDNFNRALTYEFKFEKELPTGILVGVEHNGRTKNDVSFIYDSEKYFVVTYEDEQNKSFENTTNDNQITLHFNPIENSEHKYTIYLYDKTDNENYNVYTFTIKTIKPIINLFGVKNGGKTGGSVYATWENTNEQYNASYTVNGNQFDYRKGQVLSGEGNYTISLSDELGNTATVTFEIDKTIDFAIADVTGKTYSKEDIELINFDIRIVNLEELTCEITKNDEPYSYEFGLLISEEGIYKVNLYDIYGNSIYFTFEIDKTPPKATLYGVENYGVTSGNVWVNSQESNLTCWYVLDENFKTDYKLSTELKQSGNYVVCIADKAKNITTFEFTIDKKIDFEINTYYGGISNGGVRIIAYENLQIVMLKDGQNFDYSFEQVLNEEGEYSFTLKDDLGNKQSFYFYIINKNKQSLKHLLTENIEVKSVIKDNENYEFTIADGRLYLYDEGLYTVNILDNNSGLEYSFNITIDTTPPTLELVGVENGGTTKNLVSMKNISEENCTLVVMVDGMYFDYTLGDEIEKSGQFIVTLTDEAGNSTTYTFERVYSLNSASIAVLAGLGVLVILIIILLVKSRHHYYREETVEEIEETTVTDEFDGSGDEHEENKEDI